MSDSNPYAPPQGSARNDEATLELLVSLTQSDVQKAISQYVKQFPLLIVAGILYVGGPLSILAYLEEFYGFTPPIPFWVGSTLLMSGAYAAWYLTSIPVRLLTRRNLQKDMLLRPGLKTVFLKDTVIRVEVGQQDLVRGSAGASEEYSLAETMIRGSDQHNLILEVESLRILVVPWHSFTNAQHRNEFVRTLKRRMRKFALRRFFTAR